MRYSRHEIMIILTAENNSSIFKNALTGYICVSFLSSDAHPDPSFVRAEIRFLHNVYSIRKSIYQNFLYHEKKGNEGF